MNQRLHPGEGVSFTGETLPGLGGFSPPVSGARFFGAVLLASDFSSDVSCRRSGVWGSVPRCRWRRSGALPGERCVLLGLGPRSRQSGANPFPGFWM